MIEQHSSSLDRISHVQDIVLPLVSTPPSPLCQLCAVIPVRDERDMLEGTLAALSNQTGLHGQPLDPATYEIVVLANNCQDDSAAIARRFARRHPHIRLYVVELDLHSEAHVGRARRLLMDEAYRRLTSLGKPRGIIATTDGDTRVSPTWVAATRAEINHGADAVGGRIMVDPNELRALSDTGRECHLRDVGYRSLVAELESRLDPNVHDPWPRHFQHYGASLAVTAETYQRAGRLPVKPWFEDVAFYEALLRVDARFRHSPTVQVTTSGRSSGRTGFGFAVQLTQWESLDLCAQPMCVPCAPELEARITSHRKLRWAWQAQRHGISLSAETYDSLASELGVDPGWLHDALSQPASFGLLLEEMKRAQLEAVLWRSRWPLADIREAIWSLRCRLAALRDQPPLPRLLEEIEPVEIGSLPAQVS